jgi:hypothetical protein
LSVRTSVAAASSAQGIAKVQAVPDPPGEAKMPQDVILGACQVAQWEDCEPKPLG